MENRFGYPHARQRAPWTNLAPLPGFTAIESTRGYVTITDAEADVIRFSGDVARVDLRCETFGVVVLLTDRNGAQVDTITLRANENRTVDVICNVVRASNAVGGSAGALQVVGYFQKPGAFSSLPDAAPEAPTTTAVR